MRCANKVHVPVNEYFCTTPLITVLPSTLQPLSDGYLAILTQKFSDESLKELSRVGTEQASDLLD